MPETTESSDAFLKIEQHKEDLTRPSKIFVNQAPTILLERKFYEINAPVTQFDKGVLQSTLHIEGTILEDGEEKGVYKTFSFTNRGINFEIRSESNQFIFSEGGLQIVICK